MREKDQCAFVTIPRRGPRLTLLAVGYGGIVLLWLSWEDTHIWPVILLAAGASMITGMLAATGHLAGQSLSQRAFVLGLSLWGGLVGRLAGPLAALLMLVKTAAHGHVYPDYPLPVMGATLARTPIWAMAGALMGLGTALIWVATRAAGKS